MKSKLNQVLAEIPFLSRPRQSRVHALRSMRYDSIQCDVKREDELGFGVSGTKLRKYLSLIPALLKHSPEEAIVIGSPASSHVLSLSQLLIEHGISPILFLLGSPDTPLQGNYLLSSLFSSKDKIHWFPKDKWDEVDEIAVAYARAQKSCIATPKGACCKEALPGALTLAQDIIRNEEEKGACYDHLFIDAGTGMSAVSLILAFAYLRKPCTIHVVQLAGTPEEFHSLLAQMKQAFEELVKDEVDSPPLFRLHTPSLAPAFGSVNAAVFQTIIDLCRQEGFLTDPVFTAKLFCEGKNIIAREGLRGNALFIHSGGGLSLTGFQTQLAKKLTLL
ncbi:MAG: pyridoxal-phosphate dependent enzyme [Chlamydiota bacterium]